MEKVVTIGAGALASALLKHRVSWAFAWPDGTVSSIRPEAEDDVEVRTASDPEAFELRPRTLLGQLFVSLLIAGG